MLWSITFYTTHCMRFTGRCRPYSHAVESYVVEADGEYDAMKRLAERLGATPWDTHRYFIHPVHRFIFQAEEPDHDL